MKLMENKMVCIVIMILFLLAGVLLGGYKGLSAQYRDVSDIFFTGEAGDGVCAANDMAERASNLTNMQTIGAKYLQPGDRCLQEAVSAVSTYNSAEGDIPAMFQANRIMDTAMENLYRELEDAGLSEKDESYRQRLYADFNSRNDTISHDVYFSYAQTYNQILTQFPASLIQTIMPAKTAAISY